MLGRFLEISLACDDVLAALGFFRDLGFREIPAGETWSHQYGVVSDGTLNIGLHGYQFDSPALTFVQSGLSRWAEAYRVQDIELAFAKLTPDQFNELGFVDPGGQMVAVLESRTFSPPPFGERAVSELGTLQCLEPPNRAPQESAAFWARLGRDADTGTLGASGIALRLDGADRLTCHYRGEPLTVATCAARHGLRDVSVASDERSATVNFGDIRFVTWRATGSEQ